MSTRGRHAAPPQRPGLTRPRSQAGSGAAKYSGTPGSLPPRVALASEDLIGSGPSRSWRRLGSGTLGFSLATGLLVIAVMVMFCCAGPFFYRPDLTHVNLALSNQPPSAAHLLGTDPDGVDVLGRLMTGGQISLAVGVAAGLLAAIIGSLWGALAGYLGGVADAVLMRIVDAGIAIPVIVLLLLLTSVYQPSAPLLILVIAGTSWLSTARLVRGEALTLRSREFVQAVRGMGGGRFRIIVRHIAPNALGVIAVNVSFQIADAILVLATLSYLGLGIQAPSSDWGDMIAAGVQSIYSGHWWEIYPAGVAIVVVVVAFHLIGDGLRDRLARAGRGWTAR
jgi:peptide/nickel transport system permease protein